MKTIIIFLALSISVGLNAQPIIDSTVFINTFLQNVGMPRVGYSSSDTVSLRQLLNKTGENVVWDFRTASFTKGTQEDAQDSIARFSNNMPLSQIFSMATHAIIHTSGLLAYYDYLRIDETGYYRLGSVEDTMGGGSALNALFNPPLRYLALPATYNESWNSFSLLQSTSSEGVEFDSIIGVYDAWGTLLIDGSSDPIPCVRLKQLEVSMYITPDFSDTSRTVNYVWLTPIGLTVSMSVNEDGELGEAYYSLPAGASVAGNEHSTANNSFIYVSSNPVSEKTTVAITMQESSEGSVVLIDAMGRRVKTLKSGILEKGVAMMPLQTSELSNGTYYLRVESQQQQAMAKIIVAH